MQHLLFFLTPGPLNCSLRVKNAMLTDYGSRDYQFTALIRRIRANLVRVSQLDTNHYTSVLLPGSGTTMVESVLTSIQPQKIAIFSNGAYGIRMARLAHIHQLPYIHIQQSPYAIITPSQVHATLLEHPDISHIAIVHHETTSGILNPVRAIQEIVQPRPIEFIVDAMSSFGALPIDFTPDFLISSANKCIESVPGCASVLITHKALARTQTSPVKSLTNTLYPHWQNMETTGQFLFTPPTNVLSALDVALSDLLAEGVDVRNRRYVVYNTLIRERLQSMGFQPVLTTDYGPIITAFRYPTPDFDFNYLYDQLARRGVVIYPGIHEQMFRIGNIGHLSLDDITYALDTIRDILNIPVDIGVYDHT